MPICIGRDRVKADYADFSCFWTSCFPASLMSLITAPILQEPENVAPGSIANLFVTISPSSFADFSANNSKTLIFAFNSPEMSAFCTTSPSTTIADPTTTLPLVLIDPFKVPSTRMSPEDVMSPKIVVPTRLNLQRLSFRCSCHIFVFGCEHYKVLYCKKKKPQQLLPSQIHFVKPFLIPFYVLISKKCWEIWAAITKASKSEPKGPLASAIKMRYNTPLL